MLALPPVTRVPRLPEHVRGLVNLRGRVMPLVDLRTRLGFSTALADAQSLIDLLAAREQDHHKWVAELEASVAEKRPFKLATDPHLCAFGKWYYAYKTENHALSATLRKFEKPHADLHATALEVRRMQEHGQHAAVAAVLDRSRAVLEEISRIFAQARDKIRESHQEIAVVIEEQGFAFAMTVDRVESVEPLKDEVSEALPSLLDARQSGMVQTLMKRVKDDGIVMVLEIDQLLSETAAVARLMPGVPPA